MTQLSPYLHFAGNAREAITFYKDVFQGELGQTMTYAEAGLHADDAYGQNLIHSEMKAGPLLLQASDGSPGGEASMGKNIRLALNFDSLDEQERVFAALADGGTVDQPLEDTFWGARYGEVTDRFGIGWMFNCAKA